MPTVTPASVSSASPAACRLDHETAATELAATCEPEVEELRPAWREEDVGRLDVAMDDALAVRGVERVGERHCRCRRVWTTSMRPRVRRRCSDSPSSSSIAMNGGVAASPGPTS